MTSPYVGEIRCFAGTFAPVNWATCDGQLQSISQNPTLFNLIGTTYGGDDVSTFALPKLSGRAPMHWGSGSGGFTTTIGEAPGAESVTLTGNQIPSHTHTVTAMVVAPGGEPERVAQPTGSAYIGTSNPDALYAVTNADNVAFSGRTIGNTGGSRPHENRQPYLALTFIISLFGIYRSQT